LGGAGKDAPTSSRSLEVQEFASGSCENEFDAIRIKETKRQIL
jgi:hypothetical protein